MKLNLKKFKKFNLCLAFILFLFFFILTAARVLLPADAGQGALKVMSAPLNEDVNRVADPVKDMRETVFPKNEPEGKNSQAEAQWADTFAQYGQKIAIPKDTRYRFDFKTKMPLNAELIFEFYDSKKEFVFSYNIYYENDDEKQFYVNFPGAGEYYLFASVPFDINGKPSTSTLNDIKKYSEGQVFFQARMNSWKVWNAILPAILFFLFWLILFKNYQGTLSEETVDLQESLNKTGRRMLQSFKRLAASAVEIVRNPLDLLKKITLWLPFLMALFFLLVQFGCLEKDHYRGAIPVAPVNLTGQEDSYFNYYSRKITVWNPDDFYKFRLKVSDWELDAPSGNAELVLLNSEKKPIQSYPLSFYYQERCCDSEGDDYTSSNYSESFLFQFPSAGDYYAQVLIPSSTVQKPNVSQYNLFKDNTGGELFFSVSTALNFGERPFNGILFFVSGFCLGMGILCIVRKEFFKEWNYFLLLLSFIGIFVCLFCMVNDQQTWRFYYLYGFLISSAALLLGALNFKGAARVILSLCLFLVWVVPVTLLFALLMSFLFAFLPIGGIVFFFIGISEGASPAYLNWAGGFLAGFVCWLILYIKTRKKAMPTEIYKKVAGKPYQWLNRWQ